MSSSTLAVLLGSMDSLTTSLPVFVGDCHYLSISVQTSTASASVVTVSLSNDDHRYAAGNQFFSVATSLPQQGIYTVDPGARWLRVERSRTAVSLASNTTVLLNRYYIGGCNDVQ